jgi:glycosyltransferase involved in cell wall biosynthesis
MESQVRSEGLSNISFTGRLPRERVIEEMKGARFVVFPSQLYENMPLTIIEAFACGVPVLASKLGAMQEIVSQDRTGMFFQAGNADDLARTAKLAWEQPEYMRQLGDNARAEYEAKYTAAANYRQLMEIYREVITNSAADASPTSVEELEEVSSV